MLIRFHPATLKIYFALSNYCGLHFDCDTLLWWRNLFLLNKCFLATTTLSSRILNLFLVKLCCVSVCKHDREVVLLLLMQECRVPFGAKSFYDHEGLPYCETHFHARRGSLCVTCNKPVTGRCVTAMYRKYHPEHFVCTYCQRQLNKGTFKEQNNKPYCQQCFLRLFS